MLGHARIVGQLAQQQRLLQRREGACLSAGEQTGQRLGERAVPQLYPHRVVPQAVQRCESPVAVEQHQRTGLGHRDAGAELPGALQRAAQPFQSTPIGHAQPREALLELVVLEFAALGVDGVHGR